MGQPSVKKNFAYKSVLTLSTYIMAIITFPYISRVFGVERLGLINFAENTINYFLLFATMGVSILGVREIATTKEDKEECNKVFSNILGTNILFTIATLIVYFVIVLTVVKFQQNVELFYMGAAKILFTAFLVEWYFTGVENFKYITIRSIIIRLLYVIAVFVFVKQREDYLLYFAMTMGTVVVNAIVNMLYAKQNVRIIVKELFSSRYIKDNLTLGVYSIMTSMYLTFNVMYLGLMGDNTQVGYYTTAFKLYSVILGFFTAFTNVMLPRMSSILVSGDDEQFQNMVNRSFSVMAKFSIPIILCSLVLAPQIIYVLSGPGYEGAILPMRVIMPAILLVGIAQVLAIQILMPMKRDRVLLIASICGASISILLNIFIVPTMYSVGSAIVLLSCEFVVTLLYIAYIEKKTDIYIPWGKIVSGGVVSIPSFIACLFCANLIENHYVALIVSFVLSVALWLGCVAISTRQNRGK